MAAAEPNTQSFIQGDEDPEDEPEEPYPEEPYPEEPYPEEPYPGEPGTPGNDGEPNNGGNDTPTTGTTRTVGGVTRPTGMLVPLYVHPSTGVWQRLIEQKIKHPSVDVVASVNPRNGPGPAREAAYTDGIRLLVNAGIRVVGYVSTDHVRRPLADVTRDIDAWRDFYPQVHGIFFDEQDNETGTEKWYQDIANYAKVDKGFQLTVGNPGTMYTAPGFFAAMDIMLVHETSVPLTAEDMTRELTNKGISREQCAVTPYAVSALDPLQVQAITQWMKYVYFTDDVLQNPWDTLPSYLPQLFDALDPTI